MKTVLVLSISLAFSLVSGCASVAQTSTADATARDCKVALHQPGRLKQDAVPQSNLDRAEARGKLAAIDLQLPPHRSHTGGHRAIEDALRDCP